MPRSIAIPELERLVDVERQVTALEVERVRLMADAQRQGASWEAISKALGISRQSAWETYHLRVRLLHDLASVHASADEDELLTSAATSLKRVRARRRG
jgi:hypothetical protein